MLICCASALVETRIKASKHQSRCCNFLFKGNFKGGVGGERQRRLRFLPVGSKGMLKLGMTQRFLRGSFPLQGTPPPNASERYRFQTRRNVLWSVSSGFGGPEHHASMRRDEEEEDYLAEWVEHAAGAGPIPNRRE